MGKSLEVALTSDFVWQYFTIVDTDISKATCTKCKTTVSRGNDPKKYSIHSLKRHLKTHEIIWAELENYLEQRTTPSKNVSLRKIQLLHSMPELVLDTGQLVYKLDSSKPNTAAFLPLFFERADQCLKVLFFAPNNFLIMQK